MTYEELLQFLLTMSAKDRKQMIKVFDYKLDEFRENFTICIDGQPPIHFTIE